MSRRRDKGYSLIEVLLGMLLLTFGMLAAAPMFIYAMKATAAGGDMGTVGAQAVERMELLRVTPWTNLTAGGSLTTDTTGYVDTSDPDYTVRWQITDATGPTSKVIVVRAITQRQVMGLPKTVTLTTRRAQ